MAGARSPSAFQLHVDLQGLSLPELVDRVARAALAALPPEMQRSYLEPARAEVEKVLRQHIVAFDTCGLSAICGDSEPFDPWPATSYAGSAAG